MTAGEETIMYTYEFVSAKLGKPLGSLLNEHRRIIRSYAKKGYRYVGYLPTEIDEEGVVEKIDLIFEIEGSVPSNFSKQAERLAEKNKKVTKDL